MRRRAGLQGVAPIQILAVLRQNVTAAAARMCEVREHPPSASGWERSILNFGSAVLFEVTRATPPDLHRCESAAQNQNRIRQHDSASSASSFAARGRRGQGRSRRAVIPASAPLAARGSAPARAMDRLFVEQHRSDRIAHHAGLPMCEQEWPFLQPLYRSAQFPICTAPPREIARFDYRGSLFQVCSSSE